MYVLNYKNKKYKRDEKWIKIPNVDPFGFYANVYKDGNHFVCTRASKREFGTTHKMRINPKINQHFDNVYKDCITKGITGKAVKDILKNEMVSNFSEFFEDDNFLIEYVEKRLKLKKHNLYNRLKRLKRKAELNKWNYFTTFTYDDKKMDSETFRTKLKKCLSNFSSRREWRFLGVFEHSPTENRLHFHCLLYVPENQMVGEITELKNYSTRLNKMQVTYVNTFFNKKFGINDFKPISNEELQQSNVINYLAKYLSKQNEKILYSRHTPSEFCCYIDNRDIVCTFFDFAVKYVLFDDVFNDNLEYQKYLWKTKQLSIDDFL